MPKCLLLLNIINQNHNTMVKIKFFIINIEIMCESLFGNILIFAFLTVVTIILIYLDIEIMDLFKYNIKHKTNIGLPLTLKILLIICLICVIKLYSGFIY